MLLNLKMIHRPDTLEDAAKLLGQPGTYPLYGGAALQRASRSDVEAAVSLENLGLTGIEEAGQTLSLGTMLSLEAVREACAARADRSPVLGVLGDLLAADYPLTLRNTLTLGDFLVERNPQSMALTLMLALGCVVERADVEMHLTMGAWLTAGDVMRYLVTELRIPHGPENAVVAYDKVARTPADMPIVGAVAVLFPSGDDEKSTRTILALCGAEARPVRQPEAAKIMDDDGDVDRAVEALVINPPSDFLGTAEYRTEMAQVLARRVLERVHGA